MPRVERRGATWSGPARRTYKVCESASIRVHPRQINLQSAKKKLFAPGELPEEESRESIEEDQSGLATALGAGSVPAGFP